MNRVRSLRASPVALTGAVFAVWLFAASATLDASAEIIWSGDYETGNFFQWHVESDRLHPQFSGIPAYGRPTPPDPFEGNADKSYYGDGSLLALVTSPVRQGRYAARVTVKNALNATEPRDCDNGNCTRRRSELNMHMAMDSAYNGMPYMSERWISISHYLPADWDSQNGDSWGPTVFQIKSPKTNDISPMFSIIVTNDGWQIYHRWSPVTNPNSFDEAVLPWQYQMFYDSKYPSESDWSDGVTDFPNASLSQRALSDLNKGGWTDWVIHVKFDGRGKSEGGGGFLRVWKRAGSGAWVHVLDIRPKLTTRGNKTFDHGIGYIVPNSGFGPLAGMYLDKDQVWPLPNNRVLYNDNIKIGNEFTSFADMSPDGTTPDSIPIDARRPNPPLLSAE